MPEGAVKEKTERDPLRSATLAKGLEILNFISAHSNPLRLREIVSGLELTKPTAHRILATLADYGFVRYNKDAATYQLGMRLFEMSRRVWQDFDLRGAAAAEMSRLSELTGETIELALIAEDHGTLLDRIGGVQESGGTERLGQAISLWTTAIGKALVAGINYDARQALLDALTPAQVERTRFATLADLAGHLDLVNARGYALELEEEKPGQVGVAAPILDHRGLTVAAIGLTGPANRLSRERLHELGPTLIEATRRASLRAGGSPGRSRPWPSRPRRCPPAVSIAANTRNLVGESPVWDAGARSIVLGRYLQAGDLLVGPRSGDRREHALERDDRLRSRFIPMACLLPANPASRFIDRKTGALIALGWSSRRCNSHQPLQRRQMRQPRPLLGWHACAKPEIGGRIALSHGRRQSLRHDGNRPDAAERTGWSPDDRLMYVTDTAQRTIFVYDFDPEAGTIDEPQALRGLSQACQRRSRWADRRRGAISGWRSGTAGGLSASRRTAGWIARSSCPCPGRQAVPLRGTIRASST